MSVETLAIPILFVALFAMGVHSTFFGPIKYAILPQHLEKDEVLAGTGLVEAGTYVAILVGMMLGGALPIMASTISVGGDSRGLAYIDLPAGCRPPPGPRPRSIKTRLEPESARSQSLSPFSMGNLGLRYSGVAIRVSGPLRRGPWQVIPPPKTCCWPTSRWPP